MELYVFPIAPNPTRVRLYLAEKRAAGGAPELSEAARRSCAAASSGSPSTWRGTRSAGCRCWSSTTAPILTESLAIIEYLEELLPEPPLIGRTPLERARVRELERIAELGVHRRPSRASCMDALAARLAALRPRSPTQARAALPAGSPGSTPRSRDGRPFLAGERPTIADCTLAAALQFGRFGEVELPGEHAHLTAWDERYRARAPAQSVLSL